jgi:hypothetical protein
MDQASRLRLFIFSPKESHLSAFLRESHFLRSSHRIPPSTPFLEFSSGFTASARPSGLEEFDYLILYTSFTEPRLGTKASVYPSSLMGFGVRVAGEVRAQLEVLICRIATARCYFVLPGPWMQVAFLGGHLNVVEAVDYCIYDNFSNAWLLSWAIQLVALSVVESQVHEDASAI